MKVKYVEKQIKQSGAARGLPILKKDHQVKVYYKKDTPQQARGTLDCGVVVCSLMETFIARKLPERMFWTRDTGGIHRAHMVNVICETVLKREK